MTVTQGWLGFGIIKGPREAKKPASLHFGQLVLNDGLFWGALNILHKALALVAAAQLAP